MDDKQAKVVESVTFAAPFPDGASASLELPATLRDDAGRTLENAARFPLAVRIDDTIRRSSNSPASSAFSKRSKAALPVTLRNIDASEEAAQPPFRAGSCGCRMSPARCWSGSAASGKRRHRAGKYVEEAAAGNAGAAAGAGANTGATQRRRRRRPQQLSLARRDGRQIRLQRRRHHHNPVHPQAEGARPSKWSAFRSLRPASTSSSSRAAASATLCLDATPFDTCHVRARHQPFDSPQVGRETSVIWVTRLEQRRAVPKAQVVVFPSAVKHGAVAPEPRRERHRFNQENIGEAKRRRLLLAVGPPPPPPPPPASACTAPSSGQNRAAESDFSFALSSWNRGIEGRIRSGMQTGNEASAAIDSQQCSTGHYSAQAKLVSMKHFLRRHVRQRSKCRRERAETLQRSASHTAAARYEHNLQFGADGVAGTNVEDFRPARSSAATTFASLPPSCGA